MDFTIVTASYNYGQFIGECLESVASQEGVMLEHLIIDGCSTDNTEEVVARYPHASFFQEPDKGMTDAINKGFRRARGDWVMWLNADDRLKRGALKAVKELAARSSADILHGGWDYIDRDGKFLRRMVPLPFDRRILIQQGCYIGSTACFYRRATTIAEGHLLDENFGFCMDGEYYARLSMSGKKFQHVPKILADFRLHEQSISQNALGKSDLLSVLRYQRQAAEPRAIRRVYGFKPFRDENLNLIADGILYHLFRFKKGWLQLLYRGRCEGEP